ncbi:hypothetical protein L3X38_026571 [Prunus dulcis]|uniref:Alpha-1,4 glucan phosphorylase n=1 Tax=Prunus dulcis TaxID=3755 RepID=A0AAD4YZJ6_PRUDU|nr:hypothetical protein L3X38_026571 [Prunus dulcis]
MRLAKYIEAVSGLKVSLDAMFDVHTKRIHEYKKQLLNILGIIHRYDCIEAAVDKAFANPNKWTQMSILSTVGLGIFSSDRTIQDYTEKT